MSFGSLYNGSQMRGIILPALVLAAIVGVNVAMTLRTGRARGKTGTITRAKQPQRFWCYVYSSYAVLAFCAGVILWALIWPETFQR
jgi:hypothetical protein